jgi:glucan phosphorylase
VKKVNERIAFVPDESEPMEVEQVQEEKVEKMEVEKQEEPKREPVNQEKAKKVEGLFNNDFIQRLQANLMAAKGNEGHGITHLSKILTPEAIGILLGETTPEEK